MFDFHRHFTNADTLDNAFYATISIEQWNKSAKFMSYGILANNINIDVKEFETLLESELNKNKAAHIGEIALDKRFTNIEEQISFFETSLSLTYKYNRILTIHIVNCNTLLIDLLNQNKNRLPSTIIYHGFNKSVELARQLQQFNVIPSINPTVMKSKLIKDIKQLDKIGFLLESDWDKESDDNYSDYFESFVNDIEAMGAYNFKEKNNEFRSILENF
jgi:Tat protein secretion system quality control protein TatD with DNase activity